MLCFFRERMSDSGEMLTAIQMRLLKQVTIPGSFGKILFVSRFGDLDSFIVRRMKFSLGRFPVNAGDFFISRRSR